MPCFDNQEVAFSISIDNSYASAAVVLEDLDIASWKAARSTLLRLTGEDHDGVAPDSPFVPREVPLKQQVFPGMPDIDYEVVRAKDRALRRRRRRRR